MTTKIGRACRWCLVGLAGLGLVAAGCANSSGDGGSPGAGATDQSGATSGSGTLGPGELDLGGMSNELGTGGRPDSVSPDDACATSSDTAVALPSVLQLVVDTSGSMDWPPGWKPASPDDSKPPGATKWEITRDALLGAVDALPAEVALGVNFYPNVQQEGTTCLFDEVATPVALLGPADSEARASWAEVAAGVDPVGATPTHGAYRFGLTQLVATELSGSKFALLITDGTPTCTIDCVCTENDVPVDSEPLLGEARAAFEDGIRTFVIGSPGSEATRGVLSELAVAGGTARAGCSPSGPEYCHFDMTSETDLAEALAEALAEIAVQLRSCEYPVPPAPAGEALDPARVNVLYTPPGGGTVTIARDASTSGCEEGWQYSADGRSVVLCGRACEQVRIDATGSVELLFGCETVTTQPK